MADLVVDGELVDTRGPTAGPTEGPCSGCAAGECGRAGERGAHGGDDTGEAADDGEQVTIRFTWWGDPARDELTARIPDRRARAQRARA